MKFKTLLLAALFPLSLFGATNKVDNLWIPSTGSARFSQGAPGVGKIWTSDAVGIGSWTVPSGGGGGGDVFTMSNNTFVVTKTNTFNGHTITSNLVVNGTLFANTNIFIGDVNITVNHAGDDYLTFDHILRIANSVNDGVLILGPSTGARGQIAYNTATGLELLTGTTGSGGMITIDAGNTTKSQIIYDPVGTVVADGNYTFTSNVVINGSLTVNSNFFLPKGAVSNYVWTATNATTGAGQWLPAQGGGSGITVSNLGVNFPVITVTNGTNILQKTLQAGSGVTITSNSTDIIISSTGGAGGGDVFLASNNVYVVGTHQNFSGGTFNSNLNIMAGLKFRRDQTATNYTMSSTNIYLAFKGSTATSLTNFLPAASTSITNGTVFFIKDAQKGATVTNIVVVPSAGHTIDGNSNYTIGVNGQAISIIFDGLSNWEIW